MNCKPGDLAVVVRSMAGNEGRIVRCIELLGELHWRRPDGSTYIAPTWRIDQPLRGFGGEWSCEISDSLLRPIRPGDISDEEVRDLYAPKVPEAA